MAMQLNYPFGYTEDLQDQFTQLKANCSQASYTYTSPPPYAISTSTTTSPTVSGTAAPTPTPVCASTYTVQSGDYCNAIAITHNVSTFSIMNLNVIDLQCSNLLAGATICLDKPCALYEVQPLDTWETILANFNGTMTLNQLVA
jgi:spore germination protein YaaH